MCYKKFKIEIFLFILYLTSSSLGQNDRCDDDKECRHIKTCEEMKFFLSRNIKEIKKMKVCGSAAETRDFCCKKVIPETETDSRTSNITSENALLSHKNIILINHARCGKAIGDRIFGGFIPKIGALPWMALLYYKSALEGAFKCGGSLISAKYVLTAAHCVHVPQYTLFSVRLGEHRISTELDCTNSSNPATCNTDNPTIQDIEIEKMIVHENYVRYVENDIALLRLNKSAVLTRIKNVRTICLPVKLDQSIDALMEQDKETPIMTISGWGISEESVTTNSDVLLQASVQYIPNKQCTAKYNDLKVLNPRISIEIRESVLCAGWNNKTDVCSGDSGGPIAYYAKNDKGQYKIFQQGIVSLGLACTSSLSAPGIYTRVSSFMEWILDNLED